MKNIGNVLDTKEGCVVMGRQAHRETIPPGDGERQYHHELGDTAAALYRLVQQLRREFPFLALIAQDEEDLTRAACVLLELDLLDADLLDPEEWPEASPAP